MTTGPIASGNPKSIEPGHIALLGVAIAAISSSALLVRWSTAPPLAMAFWRTLAGAMVLGPGMLRQRRQQEHRQRKASAKERQRTVTRQQDSPVGPGEAPVEARSERWLLAVAGGALGLHFATWLPSLEMTSVAASVTLVSTAPVFVALLLFLSGRRRAGSKNLSTSTRMSPTSWVAIGLAVAGTLIIAFDDLLGSPGSLDGDALALIGAMATAVYLLTGDQLRTTRTTLSYAAPTYAIASIVILGACIVTTTPLIGFSGKSWFAILGMVLGPQLCGHTVLNYLLGRMGSISISLAFLAEPIFASALVWILLSDVPPAGVWLGAPLVLLGLGLQIVSKPSKPSKPSRPSK